MKKSNNSGGLKTIFQLFFFILILYISLAHTFNWGGENIHGLCPFGGVAAFYTFVSTGDYIQHIGQSNYILIFSLMLTLFLGGAFFCGWICPLGSVQEWISKLGRKMRGEKFNKIPKRLDNVLSYFRYVVLALVIIQTARSYTLVFEAVDPYYNLFNIWTDEISITGYISVAVVLGASLFLERPFCRYACPLGALNGLFNSISFLNIKRNEESCIDCGACDRACPVNINVSKADLVNDNHCIRCMKCVDSCPVNIKTDTLNIKTSSLLANRNPKLVKAFSFGLIVMLVFASPIALTIGMGNFMTEEERIFSSADDIRGSYTLGEIFANYEIDRETFFRAFGTSELADNIPVKNLEDISGTTVESVRKVVGGLNQPLNSIITELPENIDGEQSVRNYILSNETGSINQILQAEELKVVTDEGEEIEIKRKTMLIEIKDMVKDFEDFKDHFAIPDDMTLNTQLRTLISEYGLDIEEIKAYITENRNE